MEHHYMHMQFTRDLRSKSGRALLTSSLWMRAGFVGASALACGLILLFTGEAKPSLALTIGIGGGVLATFAWRRAWAVLNHVDASDADMAGATSPAQARRTVGDDGVQPTAARARG